jgi:aspartyl-tRNA(Asn)/glutamyl-tRNA(Gln) amidotransferase subunit B
MEIYGCSPIHARTLTADPRLADFYEEVAREDPVLAATWVADTLLGELNYRDMGIDAVSPEQFLDLIGLIRAGEITDKSGIEVLRIVLDEVKEHGSSETPSACVRRLGMSKSGGSDVALVVREVLDAHPQAVADFQGGKTEAFNFMIGQVMKKTRGRLDPAELNRTLREELCRQER